MKRLALASLLLVVTLAACGSPPPPPSAEPFTGGSSSTGGPPSAAPDASAQPSPSPSPAAPSPVGLSLGEQRLLDGVARGAIACRPLREGLPEKATAAIECASDDPAVATVAFAGFGDEAALLGAYYARMDAAGVRRNSVACLDAAGESPYMPGGDSVPSRQGCYLNESGSASYWATIPGDLLLVGVIGRSGDMAALQAFAWLGNRDVPGMPTLWRAPAQ